MKFVLRNREPKDPNLIYYEVFRASVCTKCKRIYFIIDGKNYAWLDGCRCNSWVDSYVLTK